MRTLKHFKYVLLKNYQQHIATTSNPDIIFDLNYERIMEWSKLGYLTNKDIQILNDYNSIILQKMKG